MTERHPRRGVIGTLAASLLLCTAPIAQADDAGRMKDYRTFHAGEAGEAISYGEITDSFTADLVMYIAGNQFMVMEDLINDFQAKNDDIASIYVQTIPPGQNLNFILEPGQIEGQNVAQNPDLYGSVNLGHLKRLRAQGLMHDYMVYVHNKLELMVAAGNPKGIEGPQDLAREDLVHSHPNPLTEGIFRFYGADMLKEMGLHEELTGGVECKACWAVEGRTYFTERHHRETPQRIEEGLADVGIVWTTEIIEARDAERGVEGVAIPDELNMKDRVGYAIGVMTTARNAANALRFISYLGTEDAKAIYERFGFVGADPQQLVMKPIPE